ncbi:MAG: LacI family DNA-binding transcriptional regulator [Balneolales bacterium]
MCKRLHIFMKMNDKAASLQDVAKKAGVSTATVSRVLNNLNYVSHSVRTRVEKAMKDLNYSPNRVARRLRVKDGDRKLLGLLIPDIQNPFYVDVVRGVEELVFSKGYAVYICNFAQDYEKEKTYLNNLKSESIDGLIVAPYHEEDKMVISLVRDGFPIVCVDRGLGDIEVDLVTVDNDAGAYKAVKHLIGLGHKRIGYVGGLQSIPTSRKRKDGYIRALEESGIPIDDSLVKFGDSKHESGKNLALEFLNMSEPPTALFTGNNVITLGALESIHSKGLNIPDDVAIVGFDDMYWSISLNPPLTAVSQPGYEIGRQAANMLFERLEEPGREPRRIVLNTKLMIRQSCGSKLAGNE